MTAHTLDAFLGDLTLDGGRPLDALLFAEAFRALASPNPDPVNGSIRYSHRVRAWQKFDKAEGWYWTEPPLRAAAETVRTVADYYADKSLTDKTNRRCAIIRQWGSPRRLKGWLLLARETCGTNDH